MATPHILITTFYLKFVKLYKNYVTRNLSYKINKNNYKYLKWNFNSKIIMLQTFNKIKSNKY